jgi:hypothetical protein
MSARDLSAHDALAVAGTGVGVAPDQPAPVPPAAAAMPAVTIGELVGLTDGGRMPLVVVPGQAGRAALAARTVVDLHGAHIGKQVVLMFEASNPGKPIVMGVLRGEEYWPLEEKPGQVEVDIDGERLIVSARDQLILRCGKASITLNKAGKVLIRGTFVASTSSGVNRVKGGSIQLN